MGSGTQWTRVIVLTPPPPEGRGLGEPLKSLFAARDWFAVQQHDPHLAMAELCLRERAQVARSAWGLQRMEQIALVIVQPEYWRAIGSHMDEMIDAVAHYLPSASIWSAGDDQFLALVAGAAVQPSPAAPPLTETPDPGDALPSAAPDPVRGVESSTPPPALRLAPHSVGAVRAAPAAAAQNSRPAPSADPEIAHANGDDSADRAVVGSIKAQRAQGDPTADADSGDLPPSTTRITRQEIDMLLEMDPAAPESGAAS